MRIIKISAVWCPACLIMNKIWNKIMCLYPELEMINYDYDIDEEIVEKYNVGNILPVVIFYKDNMEYKRLIGEKTEQEIIDLIEEINRK